MSFKVAKFLLIIIIYQMQDNVFLSAKKSDIEVNKKTSVGKMRHPVYSYNYKHFTLVSNISNIVTWKLNKKIYNTNTNLLLVISSPSYCYSVEIFTNLNIESKSFFHLDLKKTYEKKIISHFIVLPNLSDNYLYFRFSNFYNDIVYPYFCISSVLCGRNGDLIVQMFSRNIQLFFISFLFFIFSLILITMIIANKEFRRQQLILLLFSISCGFSFFLLTEMPSIYKFPLQFTWYIFNISYFTIGISILLFYYKDPVFYENSILRKSIPIVFAIQILFLLLGFTIHINNIENYKTVFYIILFSISAYYISLLAIHYKEKRNLNLLQISFICIFLSGLIDYVNYLVALKIPYTLPIVLVLFFILRMIDFGRRLGKIRMLAEKHHEKIKNRIQLKENLKKEIETASKEIHLTQKNVISRISGIIESRSQEPSEQMERLINCCKVIASGLEIESADLELFLAAVPLHDIGTIGIPDNILLKGGELTEEEKKVMSQHPQMGYDLLKHSTQDIFKLAAIIALEHHERWDGTGYPAGKKGDEINIYSRITSIADVYSTMITKMPYRHSLDELEAIEFLLKEKGCRFDPELVDIFCNKKINTTQ